MFCCDSFVCYVIVFFVVYKLLDRLIRIPRIGNYSDRYVFVTGCDTGFGNLLAKRLDQLGCHVFAGCLTEKGETELKKVSSERLHVISLDVTNRESVRKAFECVKSKLPRGSGLCGVLNNAGVLLNSCPPDWLTVEEYKRQCDVNLWGLIDVTLTFLPLVKAEKGRVINNSGYGGRYCLPYFPAYCISKYGVEAFTDALRRSLLPFGCRALLVVPGGFHTSIMGMESFARGVQSDFDKTTPEVRAEYGEDFVKRFLMKRSRISLLNGSNRLSDVVDAYEHALLGRHPRARYLVGRDAQLFIWLQALPEWIGDWIYFKLYTDVAIPECARK